MIRVEGDWVVFHSEDNDLFYPKQIGDELRVQSRGAIPSWYKYSDDIRNGYLAFTSGTNDMYETEHRRPLSRCTPEQLAVIKSGSLTPELAQHFI